MSINKFTKFTFAAVSVGVLSVVIGSSLITNAQSSNSSNSSSNSVNTRFNDQEKGKFGDFFGKMGKEMKDGKFGGKMMGKMMGDKMSKMGDKMDKRMETEALKYKIDAGIVKAVTDAQKANQDAQNSLRDGRQNKANNITELETQAKTARENVKIAVKKFQTALFEAKVSEAKTLGVDQNIIDKYVQAQKIQSENMDKMETLRNNPETKMSEIEALRKTTKENKQIFHEAQKAFRDAVKAKTPTNSSSSSTQQN